MGTSGDLPEKPGSRTRITTVIILLLKDYSSNRSGYQDPARKRKTIFPPEGADMADSESRPVNPDALARILEVLRKNPRGTNIREIAEATKINRMSVAKYLEVLTALETVEVRAMGNAKLYYLSRRVPVTTFLKFTTKPFLVVNQYFINGQVNDVN